MKNREFEIWNQGYGKRACGQILTSAFVWMYIMFMVCIVYISIIRQTLQYLVIELFVLILNKYDVCPL